MYGMTTQFQHPNKTFFSGIRIDVRFFPVGAAIVKAMPAPGCTKIVGDQTAGYEPANRKVIHYLLKFLPEFYLLNCYIEDAFNLIP